MSAEIALRNAAALMRERAQTTPSPWRDNQSIENPAVFGTGYESGNPIHVASCSGSTAAHIASWHPAVALDAAELLEVIERDCGTSSLAYHAAAKFARTYLAEQA